ncbi:hypothetical protein ONO23_05081 [Micromonospora noduli]|uniref:DUF4345 domain-containing protein n=1 Tax=Micromonospora noduli TaxID=709876 RepID=A0A328NDZ0_9ACTN|nr:hypothetical protein [Micromonospora noduli]KAB1922634.1 hypothetical protein F8280_18305 [Micromonospora noduli]RAO04429.1 hypothetical protein LAH08_01782 [Micromonospora noduli]RAO08152.1 hypothetical protein LUPAC07_06082 [Micromonospora noduli]RAO25082.1 hypothetical protein MED15_00840 [Micromonospora noduli]RAO27593.1 hypothetical protein ONO23_05081 [Micromonospora noduli]
MNAIIRIALAILFLDNFVVGAWNAIWPASFYANFPTVDLTPPFSEHYARDFGTTSLAIALLLGIAAVKPKAHFVIPAAAAYSVFALPHFFYHLTNMQGATVGEAILLTTANAAVALIGLVIILLTALRDRSAARRDLASARAAH